MLFIAYSEELLVLIDSSAKIFDSLIKILKIMQTFKSKYCYTDVFNQTVNPADQQLIILNQTQ